jgi:hypothetical protein
MRKMLDLWKLWNLWKIFFKLVIKWLIISIKIWSLSLLDSPKKLIVIILFFADWNYLMMIILHRLYTSILLSSGAEWLNFFIIVIIYSYVVVCRLDRQFIIDVGFWCFLKMKHVLVIWEIIVWACWLLFWWVMWRGLFDVLIAVWIMLMMKWAIIGTVAIIISKCFSSITLQFQSFLIFFLSSPYFQIQLSQFFSILIFREWKISIVFIFREMIFSIKYFLHGEFCKRVLFYWLDMIYLESIWWGW